MGQTEDRKGILLESGTNELEIIEFQINKIQPDGSVKVGYYGINVAKVREIIKPPETTDYPNSHPCVTGIFNLRGRLIPLIDLAGWLGITTDNKMEDKRIIVTEFNQMFNGFSVDNVSRIYRISWENVESPSQFLEGGGNDCVVAVVRLEDRLIMLLDFEKIIADINPELSMEKYDVATDIKVSQTSDSTSRRKQHHVVIAEDSTFIRKLLYDTLHSAGYNVLTANNGQEALDIFLSAAKEAKTSGENAMDQLHLLVSDVEMPRMDGMHLVKRLREMDEFDSLPIIMFSSIMSDENRKKALSLGVNDTITKPEISRLVQLVDSYILT
ncbi:chemotaxis protein CheV [Chrysiogenes arsenatis]|uniref:chemotaxis protein CheV n=1 Tax=Chrysiogenes arsenatis TaxID=309797 RepID=UPI0003F55A36|nr:chemotaxis protein [Chrysiogenes arsenatis]